MFQIGRIIDMSNQVLWQSAFWALVSIALNLMCQPCGKILGLPSKYGFYLTSSPVICVANGLELVFKLLWRSYSMWSVEDAASLTANEIFEDIESSGRHNGLAQLQEICQMRVIVFAFGAMTQIIKLYAMTGISRTKIFASLYLGSFFVIELIMKWSKRYRSSVSLTRQSNRRKDFDFQEFLRTFAFFITISFSSIAVGGTAYRLITKSDISYAGMLVHWAWVEVMLQHLVHGGSTTSGSFLRGLHFRVYSGLLGSAVYWGLQFAIIGSIATIKALDSDTPLIYLLHYWEKGPWREIFFPFHRIYLLIFLFFCSTHLLLTRRAFRTRPKIQHCASCAFMLLHLLAAILVYAS